MVETKSKDVGVRDPTQLEIDIAQGIEGFSDLSTLQQEHVLQFVVAHAEYLEHRIDWDAFSEAQRIVHAVDHHKDVAYEASHRTLEAKREAMSNNDH